MFLDANEFLSFRQYNIYGNLVTIIGEAHLTNKMKTCKKHHNHIYLHDILDILVKPTIFFLEVGHDSGLEYIEMYYEPYIIKKFANKIKKNNINYKAIDIRRKIFGHNETQDLVYKLFTQESKNFNYIYNKFIFYLERIDKFVKKNLDFISSSSNLKKDKVDKLKEIIDLMKIKYINILTKLDKYLIYKNSSIPLNEISNINELQSNLITLGLLMLDYFITTLLIQGTTTKVHYIILIGNEHAINLNKIFEKEEIFKNREYYYTNYKKECININDILKDPSEIEKSFNPFTSKLGKRFHDRPKIIEIGKKPKT